MDDEAHILLALGATGDQRRLGRKCHSLGYHVKFANTPDMLMDACEAQVFDIVIIDNDHFCSADPHWSIRAEYQRIFEKNYTLVLCADENGDDVLEVLKRGARDFMPVDSRLKDFLMRIRKQIDHDPRRRLTAGTPAEAVRNYVRKLAAR